MAAVLVTGGTGRLGRLVVDRLLAERHDVRVLSRRRRPKGLPDGVALFSGNLDTGDGIEKAVAGADIVIHAATDPRRHRATDIVGTRHVIEALALSAPSAHLVYPSIVGIDRNPLGYYRSKLAAERLIADSPHPWTIVRTTQFHQLLDEVFTRLSRLPALPVARGFAFQPIDARDVAAHLVAVATGPALGHAEEVGGPEVHTMRALAQAWLRNRGRRRPIAAVPLFGKVATAFRAGAQLTPHRVAGITWNEYLRGT